MLLCHLGKWPVSWCRNRQDCSWEATACFDSWRSRWLLEDLRGTLMQWRRYLLDLKNSSFKTEWTVRLVWSLPSRPSASKQRRSNSSNISLDGWWIVQMMVFPLLARFFMHSTMDMAMNESRPLVGSSQNKMDGFVITCKYSRNPYLSHNRTPKLIIP